MITQTRIVPIITVRKMNSVNCLQEKQLVKEIRKKLKFREESALVLSHMWIAITR